MKNIHILQTEKPSRLILQSNNKFRLSEIKFKGQIASGVTQHIYITSDEEGVSENCWIITSGKLVQVSYLLSDEVAKGFKVILTTNKLLIKDGVQAIDDDFLEWFVKNPSCEKIEVIKEQYYQFVGNTKLPLKPNYKIIIRKEEPKQIKCYDKFNQLLSEGDYVDVEKDGVHQIYKKDDNQLYFKPYDKEDKVSAYFSNDIAKCDKNGNWINNDRYEDIVEEPKQETLEEVAEKYKSQFIGLQESRYASEDFINGAKWQQERMYSEEDMIDFGKYLLQLSNSVMSRKFNMKMLDSETGIKLTKDLFEQFKKK